MAEFAVELLKGHDNSPEGFDCLAYIELPDWLAHKLDGLSKKARGKYNLFQVVAETEKAYKIIYCRNCSSSFDFVRFTWFVDWIPKSLVKSIRTDVQQYEKEEEEDYLKEVKEELENVN